MNFHEKLRRRVADLRLNKARAARDVGLPESTISSYLAKPESMPRIDIALKIARALQVPLEWLADDAQDWPPPPPQKPSVGQLDDWEMLLELARRYRLEMASHLAALDKAERVDWAQAAKDLEQTSEGAQIPEKLREIQSIIWTVGHWIEDAMFRYNLHEFASRHRAEMPNSGRPLLDFEEPIIRMRLNALAKKPGFKECIGRLMAGGSHVAERWLKDADPEGMSQEEIRSRLLGFSPGTARAAGFLKMPTPDVAADTTPRPSERRSGGKHARK